MEPFTTLTALAAPMDRANVDTDAIIPKQYLKSIERTGFGRYLFSDWRFVESNPEQPNNHFVLNQSRYAGARILLTRENFGCGSSREHAPWALTDFGFRCLIGPSFADIFYSNALKNGLLPAITDAKAVDELFREVEANEGCQLTVDLASQRITSPGGIECGFEIQPQSKHNLLHGLDDIGLTLQHEPEITTYEKQRAAQLPWLIR